MTATTTYSVHHPANPFETADAHLAESFSRLGFDVTAVTEGGE